MLSCLQTVMCSTTTSCPKRTDRIWTESTFQVAPSVWRRDEHVCTKSCWSSAGTLHAYEVLDFAERAEDFPQVLLQRVRVDLVVQVIDVQRQRLLAHVHGSAGARDRACMRDSSDHRPRSRMEERYTVPLYTDRLCFPRSIHRRLCFPRFPRNV